MYFNFHAVIFIFKYICNTASDSDASDVMGIHRAYRLFANK